MTGKEQCDILKRMREKIAQDNGIEGFEYKQCSYGGLCQGTCPACDAEAESLYDALQKIGKTAQYDDGKHMDLATRDLSPYEIMAPIIMGKIKYDDNIDNEPIRFERSLIDDSPDSEQGINNGSKEHTKPIQASSEPRRISGQMECIKPPKPITPLPDQLIGKVVRRDKMTKESWDKDEQKTDNDAKKPRGLLDVFKKKDGDEK